MVEIPEETRTFINELSETTQIPANQIEDSYAKYKAHVKDDPQFQDESALERFLRNRLRAAFQNKSPAVPQQIIPIGMSQIRRSKSKGNLYANLYVIDSKRKLRQISFKGDICNDLRDIQLYYPYKDVPLVEFSNSEDFMADDRSDFSNLIDKKLDPMKIPELSGAKRITLKDIILSDERKLKQEVLTRVDDRGWPIRNDWREFHGNVQNIGTNTDEKDCTNSGFMTLVDDTVPVSKEIFDKEGKPMPKNLSCWISPLVAGNITKGSDVIVLGTLNQNPKNGRCSMDAFTVIPTYIYEGA